MKIILGLIGKRLAGIILLSLLFVVGFMGCVKEENNSEEFTKVIYDELVYSTQNDAASFYYNQNNAAITWIAPTAGAVDITGTVSKVIKDNDDIVATIYRNNSELWRGEVKSVKQVESKMNNIKVNAGDRIAFSLDSKETEEIDTVRWEPVVTLTTAVELKIDAIDSMLGSTMDDGIVQGFSEGDYILFKNVDLKTGFKTFEVELSATVTGGNLEVWLGGLDAQTGGKLAGSLTICNTDGMEHYETQVCELKGASGICDIYIKGALGDSIVNVKSIKLSTKEYRGATMPFDTYEAEDFILGGGAELGNNAAIVDVSSHKAYVNLDKEGEFIEWSNLRPANKLTIRFSIMKGINRGDSKGTINLYIDGVKQAVKMSDVYCYDWNGGHETRYYDEVVVDVNLYGNETIKIQKDEENNCDWYAIDLIDLEYTAAPLIMPDQFLSIVDFGAIANDGIDDAPAINACVAAANAAGKGVWLPSGQFIQQSRISLPKDMQVRGAGMWYTQLHNASQEPWGDTSGFALSVNNYVSDMSITGDGFGREKSGAVAFAPAGSNCKIENVIFKNRFTITGWSGNYDHLTIENCRFIGLYCDAIHLGDYEAADNRIINNFFRGLGDDAIAQVHCEVYEGVPHNNIAQFNTISALYWGRGLSLVGGYGTAYKDNIVDSGYNAGVILTTEKLDGKKTSIVTDCKIQRNTISRNGHTGHNHAGIHIWLGNNDIKNNKFEVNDITDNVIAGMKFDIWKGITYSDHEGSTQINNNNFAKNPKDYINLCMGQIDPVLKGNKIKTKQSMEAPPVTEEEVLDLDGVFYIKKSDSDYYLYETEECTVGYAELDPSNSCFQWYFTYVPIEEGTGLWVRNNGTGKYMCTEPIDGIESLKILQDDPAIEDDFHTGWYSTHWILEQDAGAIIFKSVWHEAVTVFVNDMQVVADRINVYPDLQVTASHWILEKKVD